MTMTYSTIGNVYYIGDKLTFSSRLQKVELGITRTDGSPYPNINLEFLGDDIEKITGLQKGTLVKITFELQGKQYITKDGQPRNFNVLRGRSVEIISAVDSVLGELAEENN